MCIHSEIIIINKYGLNEYTKKRLGTKGDEDVELTRKTNRISNCSFNEENIIKKKNTNNNSNSFTAKMKLKKRGSKEINIKRRKFSLEGASINPLVNENEEEEEEKEYDD